MRHGLELILRIHAHAPGGRVRGAQHWMHRLKFLKPSEKSVIFIITDLRTRLYIIEVRVSGQLRAEILRLRRDFGRSGRARLVLGMNRVHGIRMGVNA